MTLAHENDNKMSLVGQASALLFSAVNTLPFIYGRCIKRDVLIWDNVAAGGEIAGVSCMKWNFWRARTLFCAEFG
jgi:hypothetical protein